MPPPSNGPQQTNTTSLHRHHSHAIDRSSELLSVARTALLIAQQQQQGSSSSSSLSSSESLISALQPSDLTLHNDAFSTNNTAKELLSEAMLTLNHLDETLKKLWNLVKRRGHTNDPTNDINLAMRDFHSFVKDMVEITDKTLPEAAALPPFLNHDGEFDDNVRITAKSRSEMSSSSHRRKHYEMAAKTLKTKVEVKMEEFKNVMKVRAEVLKDLTSRRERLLKNNNNTEMNMNGMEHRHSDEKKTNSGSLMMMGNNFNQNTSAGPYSNGHGSAIRKRQPISGGGAHIGTFKKNTTMAPSTVKSQLNSPLFQIPSSKASNPYAKPNNLGMTSNYSKQPLSNGGTMANNSTNLNGVYQGGSYGINKDHKAKAIPESSTGYGGASAGSYGYGGSGYGGCNNISNSTGMRRRAGNSDNSNSYNPYQMEEETKVHNSENIQTQIQQRRQARQTQSRLESARMAEKTLAELTSMFGKMSNLIQSQGETLVKIEDDVEIAMGYVDDAHNEVGKLYEWTRGNRGLIIKCFGILIFFVIFMKFYG